MTTRVAYVTAECCGAGHAVRGIALVRAGRRAGIEVRAFGPVAPYPALAGAGYEGTYDWETQAAAFAPDLLIGDLMWSPLDAFRARLGVPALTESDASLGVANMGAVMRGTDVATALPSLEAVDSSLYEALERSGHRPVHALQRLRAVLLTAGQAELLKAKPGDAGLLVERLGSTRDGRAIEMSQSYYRGDTYDFVAELSSNP